MLSSDWAIWDSQERCSWLYVCYHIDQIVVECVLDEFLDPCILLMSEVGPSGVDVVRGWYGGGCCWGMCTVQIAITLFGNSNGYRVCFWNKRLYYRAVIVVVYHVLYSCYQDALCECLIYISCEGMWKYWLHSPLKLWQWGFQEPGGKHSCVSLWHKK